CGPPGLRSPRSDAVPRGSFSIARPPLLGRIGGHFVLQPPPGRSSVPMPIPAPTNPDQFRRLVEIMDALLSPEGCPWDRKQTHETLKPYAIEEAYEVCEAIDGGDVKELCGELGDLGLQIVFHA